MTGSILACYCGFNPTRDVEAIRNGYWWHAAGHVGIGTDAFRVVEQNAHAAFDFVQATVASQATVLSENGTTQFRMRKAADPFPSVLTTLGAVQAGWTGSTYLAGWFRLPDASGVITGNGNLFQHGVATGSQLRTNHTITVAAGHTLTISADGAVSGNNTYANSLAGGWWCWHETFTPDAAGVDNATRIRMFANGVELIKTGGSGDGVVPASIKDSSAKFGVACRVNNTLANVDTTDWAALYYANGIPSAEERALLARHYAPVAVSF